MKSLIDRKNNVGYASKIIVLMALCFTSFIIAVSSSAVIFNPFILSSIWISLFLSPINSIGYLVSLAVFSFIVDIQFGMEVVLLEFLFILFNFIIKLASLETKYHNYYSLAGANILLLVKFLINQPIYATLLNGLITIFISFIICLSLEKLLFSIENKGNYLTSANKIVLFSLLCSLFSTFGSFNLFLISIVTLLYSKYEDEGVIFGGLLVTFIINYLYLNTSVELIIIYLISLTFSLFVKKLKPVVFISIITTFFIIQYKDYYLDLMFYLNFLVVIIYYFWPKQIDDYLENVLVPLNYKEKIVLQDRIYQSNIKIDQLVSFLTLLKENPLKDKDLEKEIKNSIHKTLCNQCQNKSKCKVINLFSSFLNQGMNKEDKNLIINNCFYPYKLIKRIETLMKNYQYQKTQQENKIIDRHLFNRQIDTILRPLQNIHNEESILIQENKYIMEYEGITQSFSKNNGDTYQMIEGDNKTIFLLSDGMGHIEESKRLSNYLIDLFTSIYSLNKNEKQVIQDMNLIIRTKTSEEIFATLDLASFDLVKGTISLYKAGSFSTFLIRKGKVISFNKISPPLGIIDRVDIVQETFSLQNEDYLIFLSDGFLDDVTKIIEFSSKYIKAYSLYNFTKMLFNELKKESKINDDKTLVVIKIKLI